MEISNQSGNERAEFTAIDFKFIASLGHKPQVRNKHKMQPESKFTANRAQTRSLIQTHGRSKMTLFTKCHKKPIEKMDMRREHGSW